MNIRGEKSLATRAHQQIGICCETLCEKEVVQEYIQELETQVQVLKQRLEKNNETLRLLTEVISNKTLSNKTV